MTNAERDELITNAWAQATAAQAVLAGVLRVLMARDDKLLVELAFEIASESAVGTSHFTNPLSRKHGVRVLQVVDQMRQSVLGKDFPKTDPTQ